MPLAGEGVGRLSQTLAETATSGAAAAIKPAAPAAPPRGVLHGPLVAAPSLSNTPSSLLRSSSASTTTVGVSSSS